MLLIVHVQRLKSFQMDFVNVSLSMREILKIFVSLHNVPVIGCGVVVHVFVSQGLLCSLTVVVRYSNAQSLTRLQ